MSTYRLDRLFAPHSVALVGASPRPSSIGRTILNNLRMGGFAGPIQLVNPRYSEIEGVTAVKSIANLPDLQRLSSPRASVTVQARCPTPPHARPAHLACASSAPTASVSSFRR